MSSSGLNNLESASDRSMEWDDGPDDSLENLFNDSNEETGAVTPTNALQLWDENKIEK